MSWDEKLIEACTETDGSIHPHTDHALSGAKWMREQLRTNEAIERVANCLHSLDHGETLDHHDAVCERDRGGCDRRELYSEDARVAITALLGEEP